MNGNNTATGDAFSINSFDVQNMNAESLKQLKVEDVISLVLVLKEENDKLKHFFDSTAKDFDKWLEAIERAINLGNQYSRRDTIEICGIPRDVEDTRVEDECLKILKTVNAKIGTKSPTKMDIQAAHWKQNKKSVIVKFVNRKFAASALTNRSSLKDKDIYGDNSRIFINQSLCPEFGFINFAVRRAKKNNEIHFYKMKHGATIVQKEEHGRFVTVSHINDLTKLGLSVPPRNNENHMNLFM